MSGRSTDDLIEELSIGVAPVKRLSPPLVRALTTFGMLAGLALAALVLLPKGNPLTMRGGGDEILAGFELCAALLTGALALVAAFHLAIPGRSRGWLALPLPAFVVWVGVSGFGCWRVSGEGGSFPSKLAHSLDCLVFILVSSAALGAPLAWRLSRAAPIDPLPVAALGGLGVAALSAFLLQFFHPFAVTFLDLAVHIVAIGLVMTLASIFRRPMLRAA